MKQPRADHLRIYREEPPETAQPRLEESGDLPELLRAFERATGWSLRYGPGPQPNQPIGLTWSTPVNPGVGATPGHLRLDAVGSQPRVDQEAAQELGSAVAHLLGQLNQVRYALWQREAELAAGIPLVPHRDEKHHLAKRMESAMRAGAEAVGCEAAALYMLDDATTSLKLRSCWGLPWERLAHPPRPLQNALADLEAMLGHAVVLDDTDFLDHWNPPEDFMAAVCLPVSTPTTILGTIWFFSDDKRDFSNRETGMLEIVAGRIAVELEREILLSEGLGGAELKRQLISAERTQRNQLPTVQPLLDGWDIAGWTAQSHGVGGDFFDWFALPDGLVAVAVADVMDRGIEAAISASTVKAALRSHGQYHRQPEALLKQANMTVWTGSAGDQRASVFCGLVDTATGGVRYASAGDLSAVQLSRDDWSPLIHRTDRLGESPEASFNHQTVRLKPGEVLVVFTDGIRDAQNQTGTPLGVEGVARGLVGLADRSAKELAAACQEILESHALDPNRDDRTVLVVKRTAS